MKKPVTYKKIFFWILFYFVHICVVLFFIFPIFWIATTSLKQRVDVYTEKPVLIFRATWENYQRVFQLQDFSRYLLNSLIVAGSVTLIIMYLGALAAYALTRWRFVGYNWISLAIISARMFPPIALLPSFFLFASRLGLVDTRQVLVFAHATYGLPFIVFMLAGFFRQIPRDLDDAALIDGCSRWQLFNRIMLPSVAPGLAAAAILSFVWSWNEFLFALVLTRASTKTLPVVISEFIGFVQVDWQGLTAMATILMIPSIIITFATQRYLVRGLTAGAVKY
ncbi:carbohydrate ABC transporter permease [Atribacter laminatus]|uniref:Trehalose transport system permease protein SugB n=1 Tax=Atribacter laminatus TaxID=2847778 RepID=A0A7T1F1T3_ATRLM|nr:carbohydrate ABC transporter permease [Atribacter laminatus]QPM67037.1 Trehalose transport system permease protein SugB [Atribacter laminatus]